MMKVLFLSRKTLFSNPGGDTIQIVKTAEFLEKKFGIKVDISTELEPNLKGYDLVHLFNLIRPQELYIQALHVKRNSKPLVLSPIFVDYSEYERKGTRGIRRVLANILPYSTIEYLKILARGIRNKEIHKGTISVMIHGYFRLMKKICELTDVFLPNSNSEMERLKKKFKLRNVNFVIVPNAVDLDLFNYQKVSVDREIEKRYKNCILCVGRIEELKSQLTLVKAVKNLPYKLVIIGKPSQNHLKYYKEILKEVKNTKNVEILDYVPHEKLPQYYKVAKVHALVSWFETTGLVSLEAGAMKCNLVISKKGDTYDYFKDYAFYCEPDNIDSIRKALISAYELPFNENLYKLIVNNYTWEKAVQKTLQGYELALKIGGKGL